MWQGTTQRNPVPRLTAGVGFAIFPVMLAETDNQFSFACAAQHARGRAEKPPAIST
jgi:hypothetical protein